MKSALVLIDVQNDYFPGGRMELEGSAEAILQARRILEHFRGRGHPIVHVQHISARPDAIFFLPGTDGVEIREEVRPGPGETLFQKQYPNAFRDTGLLDHLKEERIERLIICGMMTHMCVDSTVRAAFDYGFPCVLLRDACATRSLSQENAHIPAGLVHSAFIAALSSVFARVLSVADFLNEAS